MQDHQRLDLVDWRNARPGDPPADVHQHVIDQQRDDPSFLVRVHQGQADLPNADGQAEAAAAMRSWAETSAGRWHALSDAGLDAYACSATLQNMAEHAGPGAILDEAPGRARNQSKVVHPARSGNTVLGVGERLDA